MGGDIEKQETQVFLFCPRGRGNTRERTEVSQRRVCQGWYKDTGKEVLLLKGKKEPLKILSEASPGVGSERLREWMESKGGGVGAGLREYLGDCPVPGLGLVYFTPFPTTLHQALCIHFCWDASEILQTGKLASRELGSLFSARELDSVIQVAWS